MRKSQKLGKEEDIQNANHTISVQRQLNAVRLYNDLTQEMFEEKVILDSGSLNNKQHTLSGISYINISAFYKI